MHATEPPEGREALVACLGQLAGLVGVPVDARRLRDACERASSIPGRGESARFERLAAAAGDCGLRVVPVRMPIADVLWRAGAGSPFAAIGADGGWMIVSGRGFFRGKIVDPATGAHTRSASREEIARRLGIPDVNAPRDFAVVQSATPVSAPDVIPGHDGDHGHPGPHRRLWALLRPEMADVRAIVGFSVITGILYLAVPLTVDAVVNNIAFGGQQRVYVQALLVLSVALLAVLALLAMVRAAQHHLAEVIQRRIFVRLSADLAHRLPRVAAAETDRVHAPEMVNRFFDVVTVQKSSSLLLLDGVNLVLSAVIGMVVLAFYHPSLLAFVFVLLALICLVVFGLGRGAVRTSIEESKAKYAVAGWLEELAVFPNLFKGPGGARFAMDRADALLRRYLDSRRAHFRVLMRQIGGLLALQALASSSLLAVGGFLVLSGELTLGQLVASEIIVTAVVASVAKLGKHLEGWYDAMAAMDKIGHLVDLETERESGGSAGGGEHGARLEAKDVCFAYPGGKEVLRNVSFAVEPGARVALVGPAGAGTSTLLDLIYGLRTAQSGHASVDGLDLRQWSLAELRNVVSLVRGHDIVDASVADNVRLARPGIGMDEVRGALGDAGLLDDVLAMPQGFDSPILLGGRPLTGLQRTRLVVARAIVGKPRLLLLDGTLDGLASGDLEALSSVLFDPSRPWTVVVATREPDVIRKCNVVVRLGVDAGRGTGSSGAN